MATDLKGPPSSGHTEGKSCPAPYREHRETDIDSAAKFFITKSLINIARCFYIFLVSSVALPVGQLYFYNAKPTKNTWAISFFCMFIMSEEK